MSKILVDEIRSNSASGDAITLDGSGKCAINATTINNLTFPTSDGTSDQIIKTNGSGALSFTTVASGFTPESQAWRISANFSGDAYPILSSNWEAADNTWEGNNGTALLTESSGVFTFAKTGHYRIGLVHTSNLGHGHHSIWGHMCCMISTNSGTAFSNLCYTDEWSANTNHNYHVHSTETLFKVLDASTYRLKFWIDMDNINYTHEGSSNLMRTGFTLIRVGDI